MEKLAKILILMSTYNGEKYLQDQIESLRNQADVDVDILVRDDRSTDLTRTILCDYGKMGVLTWYTGDNLKPAKSFLDLVNKADDSYMYYAFCDQDDIWEKDKCAKSIERLNCIDQNRPAICYCRAEIVDEDLNPIDCNSSISDEEQANSAVMAILASSGIPGCTMTLNRSLIKLLKMYAPKIVSMHDSWAQRVCIACNGIMLATEDTKILYRQHGNNAIGAKGGKKKSLDSLFNSNNIRSRTVIELKKGFIDLMSKNNREFVELICDYRQSFIKTVELCRIVPDSMSLKMRIMYTLSILLHRY